MKAVSISFVAGLALVAASSAFALPKAVPGAPCVACHAAMPPSKANLKPKAAEMLKLHKSVDKCAECHAAVGGKLTVKAK